MSTRLKLSPSLNDERGPHVINADEIVSVTSDGTNKVNIIVTTTTGYGDKLQGVFKINVTPNNSVANVAMAAAINKALVAAPAGRLLEVPASKDYKVNGFIYSTEL